MGFLSSCTKALVHWLTFSPFSHDSPLQQPLQLSSQELTFRPEAAKKGFHCHYPRGWESCNTPSDRQCWIRKKNSKQPLFNQFDINSDYEAVVPHGIHREFWVNVTDATISPDGYLKHTGKVVNGTYPGPLIEACWGDNITVHVTNYVEHNGSTIHWHGLRQLGTNSADGVNGVTQCPIAPGQTYTYNFRAQQYGHTWYHSHYSLQYPDGVAGPLLIHGPNSGNWDEAFDPIFINDWGHRSAFQDFQVELGRVPGPGGSGPIIPGREPSVQTVLLGGVGNATCSSSDPLCVPAAQRKPIFSKVFQKGKKYLLRLINTSTESNFVFYIDNHQLEVISNDFVPIQPFKTDQLHISIGKSTCQRYSVIVEANPIAPAQSDGNYWIRTIGSDNCSNLTDNKPLSGVIRYDPESVDLPTSVNHSVIDTSCVDMPVSSLVPVVPWVVDTQPVNDVLADTFDANLGPRPTHQYVRWDLTSTPLWLNFSNPTILNLDNTTFNPEYAIVEEDYNHGFVYLIITSNNSTTEVPPKIQGNLSHPIHLHGHDFVILAQSSEEYDVHTSPKTFNFNNPPRRDVALLPARGYLAIAFRPDNPGIWLVHCHIAWHASSGLAMQILERQGDIVKTVPSLDQTEENCKSWDKWLATHQIDQDDSGI